MNKYIIKGIITRMFGGSALVAAVCNATGKLVCLLVREDGQIYPAGRAGVKVWNNQIIYYRKSY